MSIFDRDEFLGALPADLAELVSSLDARLYYSGIDNYGTHYETRESRYGPGPGIGRPWTRPEGLTTLVSQGNTNNTWGWYIPEDRHPDIPPALWDVLGMGRLSSCWTTACLAYHWERRQDDAPAWQRYITWLAYGDNNPSPAKRARVDADPYYAPVVASLLARAGDAWYHDTIAHWREQDAEIERRWRLPWQPPADTKVTYYTVLDAARRPCHGGAQLPEPGIWREIRSYAPECLIWLCRREDIVRWLGPTIWEVEAEEADVHGDQNKVFCRRARLVRRIDTWDERTARLFAADCAERVLHIYEARYPDDGRPRDAIAAARAGADVTEAAEAAWDAARSASAEWAASRRRYRSAESAEGQAAAAAARAADTEPTWSASIAACHAARATFAAARDSAPLSLGGEGTAAQEAERLWQTETLFAYLSARRTVDATR